MECHNDIYMDNSEHIDPILIYPYYHEYNIIILNILINNDSMIIYNNQYKQWKKENYNDVCIYI